MADIRPIPASTRFDHPVVVTGGAGFLGREVVRLLNGGGCRDVRVVDLRHDAPSGAAANALDVVRDDLGPVMRGAGTVLHLAACQYHSTLAPNAYDLPFAEVNVTGTRRVLEAARAAGVARFLFLSSSMVYGVPLRTPIDDAHPCRPVGPYGRSKLEAEGLARAAAGGGMTVAILRAPPLFGPGRIGAVTRVFDRILEGRRVVLIGDGRNRQELMACDDCAELVLAVAQDASGRVVFHGGSAEAPTMRGWIEALIAAASSRSVVMEGPALAIKLWLAALERARLAPLRREQYEIADRDYVLDIEASRATGWAPRSTGVEAALATFDWYRSARNGPGATPAAR